MESKKQNMDKKMINQPGKGSTSGGKKKKSSTPGVKIIEFTENIPRGCSAPDIVRRPIPQTMQEDKNANFKATVQGNPEPTVVWSFKEENLSNDDKYGISHDTVMNEYILQVKQLTTDDAGSYKCTVSNEYGQAICITNLNIIEVGFKKKLKKPEEMQDQNTDPVDFRKMLKKCAPPPEKKDGKIPDEKIWEILMHADKKDYEKICIDHGFTDFRGMLKKLNQMKKERKEKQAVYVKSLSNLKQAATKSDGSASFGFDMELKNPALRIYLYKDGKLIQHSLDEDRKHYLKKLGKRYTFCIKDLQLDDVGFYKVNVEDTAVFATNIDITLIPVDFKRQLQEVKCKETEDGCFECTISLPLPVEWSYKKIPLENSDKYQIKVSPDGLTHQLIVKDVRLVDKGVYTVSAGLRSSSACLTVEKCLEQPDTRSPLSRSKKSAKDSEHSQDDSLDINLKQGLDDTKKDGLKGTTSSSLHDKDLMTKDGLKGENDFSSEDDSAKLGRGGLSTSTDGLDNAAKSGHGGYDRMGKDGSGGLNEVGKDGFAGLDGMGKDGKGRLDGMGKDGKGGLDGMGKDGKGRLDGMGKDGKGGLDGMGKDGKGRLDGMGKDGKGGLDGMGKDGEGRLDGMGKDGKGRLDGMGKDGEGRLDGMGKDGKGRLDGMGKDGKGGLDGMGKDGKGGLDGMGKDGSNRMDGSGINNLAGLDGSGKGGRNGLDTSGWGEMQNNLAVGSNQDKDGLKGYGDSTSAGTGDKGQLGLNDTDALKMAGDLSNMSGSDGSAKGECALSLGNQKSLLGEDQMSSQNESMVGGKQDMLTSDSSQRPQSGSARRKKEKLSESDISELTADQNLKNKGKRAGTNLSRNLSNEPVRRFKSGLSDVSARKGEAAELYCMMENEKAEGSWFKNGTKITSGDGKIITKDGATHKLTIPCVRVEDSGMYTFEADGGKTEASLFVDDPPEFDQDVLDQLGKKVLCVKAGHTATVKVPFSGKPPIKISWYKDGDELFEDNRINIDNGENFTRLSISKCNRKDSGKLTVKLKNESGTANANFSLAVTDKPQAPQGPVEVLDSSESCISFKWKPPKDDGGKPLEHYIVERQQVGRNTWFKVGEVDKSTTTFTFDKVEHGKNYKFKVKAVNSEGISEALVSDTVAAGRKAIPGPPAKPKILNASSKSISLSWTPPHNTGSSRIIGYVLEKRKKGSNTWSVITETPITDKKWTVTDVIEGLEYEFRVIAVNSSGLGEPSCETEAVFAREPIKPPGTIKDLRVTNSTYSTITLAWTPPTSQGNDVAKGYIVEMKSSESTSWTRCNTAAVGLTSYTVKGLKKMEMHFLRVRAVNDGGMGEPIELDNYVLAMPPPVSPKFILDGSVKSFMIVEEGNSIRVRMPFEASPPPEVIWLKDGLPLSKQATVTSTNDGTQLFIPISQRSDSGIYTVTLKNHFGQESSSFEIRATAIPKPPGPVTLNENVPNTVTVYWEPSRDEPLDDHLHYVVMKRDSSRRTWYTVGDNIVNNKFTVINIVPGCKYYFRVLAKNDMGYSEPSDTLEPWCISKQRDPFTLKLPNYKALDNMRAPEFTVKLKTHIAPTGSDITMSCAVRGFPPPKVSWFKNNVDIMDDANFWSTNVCGVCSLCIFCAGPKDTGEYMAIAENLVGRAVCSTNLIVRE